MLHYGPTASKRMCTMTVNMMNILTLLCLNFPDVVCFPARTSPCRYITVACNIDCYPQSPKGIIKPGQPSFIVAVSVCISACV
jgi:hypothetical protein